MFKRQSRLSKHEPEADPQLPDGSIQFPIVGIGASAGGMEAFREILRHLPPSTGMGFVYIQHLDPVHQSILADIFARDTTMRVVQASEGDRVKPNEVYVIPPNTTMTLDQGALRLTRRVLPPGHHLPIDEFFRSLAEDHPRRGIAVVLSGASSDGALGLQAVKQCGGVTFAQDASAKHDVMPHHAINTGAVDFVLPPSEIAAELGRIANHPYLTDSRPESPEGSDDCFKAILTLLRDAKGTDFSQYRATTLRRRIARRMSLCHAQRIEDYLPIVQDNAEELEALFNEMLIKVTNFFRDPAVFESLTKFIFPALVKARPADDTIRIWVPACSTGEEAYSLAIAFMEWRASHSFEFSIQIFGTDLSQLAIDTARRGLYVENICMDVPPEILEKYFHRVSDHYQINKPVRDLCVFARHDVTKDPPFSRMDLVSCRNMLIYMSSPLQQVVVEKLHFGLKPRGFLILGSAESVLGCRELFSDADKKNGVFSRISPQGESTLEVTAVPERKVLANRFFPENVANSDTAMIDEADRVSFTRAAHPGVVVESSGRILQFRGYTGPFLAAAPGRASLDVMKMAREELRAPLRTALQRAAETGNPVHTPEIQIAGAAHGAVNLDVLPLRLPGLGAHFLILFELETLDPSTPRRAGTPAEREIIHLRQQLAAATEYLQTVIEELKASHEEVLSNNEELQSVNEELETGKEELQSGNEELTTVNEQLEASNISLNQANADLRNLLASVAFPIIVLTAELKVRLFTPAASKVFNLLATDVGRQLGHIRSNLTMDNFSEFILECLKAGKTREIEVSDNAGNSYLMRVTPSLDQDTSIEGVILTLVDIGSRKRVEEERERMVADLQREKAQLARLIEYMPSAVVVADASGRILVANQHVERIFGAGAIVPGHSVFEMDQTALHPDGTVYQPDEWPIVRALRAGENVKDETLTLARSDGMPLSIRCSAAPIRDGGGQILLALALLDEITDVDWLREKLANTEKLAQSQRLETIGRLAGGVAHDFNNQLTVIIGFSQFVREDPALNAHLQEQIDTILNAAKRAAALTSQLLAFSRKQPIQLRHIDLNALVGRVGVLLRRLVGANIEIEIKLSDRPCLVMADSAQMEQVVMNLVTNSRDAMDTQGKIVIETGFKEPTELSTRKGGWSTLLIADNGRGMTQEVREHIFEPFYTTKEFGRGTGLGLASVFGTVKQHEGEISVESAPGAGTRIEIMLPCSDAEGRLDAAEQPVPPQGRETILLVEDEAAVRAIAQRTLEHLGYHVLEAANGRDGLRIYGRHLGVVDMVLTDVVMPEMQGPELVKNLRRMQPGIKVAFMSGYPQDVLGERGIGDEHLNFIQKPFNITALSRTVRRALDD